MSFLSPERLWFLAGPLALAVVYVLQQRRRPQYAVRWTSLHLLDLAAPEGPGWRKHLPAGLFLAMLLVLVVGFARPVDDVRVPRERATVVVAVDVSRSMLADDVDPDRLGAARDAARRFVGTLPKTFNVGLVAFAGEAAVIVPPITDRAVLDTRIRGLSPDSVGEQGTAIGEAIGAALMAVRSLDAEADTEPPPARAIVLSDGANTAGRPPEQVAAEAAQSGLPIDTISFGTPEGTIPQGPAGITPVPVDGTSLRTVAEISGGNYHEAGDSEELGEAYADVGSSIGYRAEEQDVSARFIGFGLLLAFAAAAASLRWFSRLP